jgi:hypothetical protein
LNVCVTSTAILIHLSAVVFSVAAIMAVFYNVSFVQKILDGSHGFSTTFNKKLHLDISKTEQNNLFIKINTPTGQAYSNFLSMELV